MPLSDACSLCNPCVALQVEEVAKVKLQKSKQLRAEAAKDWREINDGTLRFKRQHEEVAELRQLGKQDLLAFMQVIKSCLRLTWTGHCCGQAKTYAVALKRQVGRTCRTLSGEASGVLHQPAHVHGKGWWLPQGIWTGCTC